MPVDFSSPEGDVTPLNDSTMFAPTPLWDRDARKRRGRRPASTRTAADLAIDPAPAEPTGAAYEAEPAATPERVTAPRRGVPAGAVAAGVVAVAAVAAIGWYTSRPHDSGMAELTPGVTATSETALNTAAPPSASQLPVTPAPAAQTASTTRETTTTTRASTPAATRRTATTVAARAPTPRVRTAHTESAMDTSVNASTTAPITPAMDPVPVSPVTPVAPATSPPNVTAPQPSAPTRDPTVTP